LSCSSDTEDQKQPGDASGKSENPIKAYVDHSRNMMGKPAEIQQQLNDAMKVREENLQNAKRQY
jgi:hypothetical protein